MVSLGAVSTAGLPAVPLQLISEGYSRPHRAHGMGKTMEKFLSLVFFKVPPKKTSVSVWSSACQHL